MMTLKKKLRKPLLLIENPRKGKNMKKSIKVTEKWKKKKMRGIRGMECMLYQADSSS